MITTKTCTKCHKTKLLSEFYKSRDGKYSRTSYCKECISQNGKEYRQKHPEEIKKRKKVQYEKTGREKRGCKSMYENKLCSQYLGIVIGERLVRHLFKDVQVMPHGNPKFDFICNRGKKVDVKTSTTHFRKGNTPHWEFKTNRNTTVDFFILVAFDNRTDLNPLHMWMIPGNELSHLTSGKISSSTIHKWDVWKKDINDAELCCTEIKKENKQVT